MVGLFQTGYLDPHINTCFRDGKAGAALCTKILCVCGGAAVAAGPTPGAGLSVLQPEPSCPCPRGDGLCHQPGESYAPPDGCKTCFCDGGEPAAAGEGKVSHHHCTKMFCGVAPGSGSTPGGTVPPP